jgi:DNA polymerase III subunit epsilon
VFRDRAGAPLYVGKAKNLRSRVRSYFYGDPRRSVTQMLRILTEIEHRVCATELEAEITEVRLINALVPRFNRRSRPPKSSYWVKVTLERYPRLSLVRTLRQDGLAHVGPFRSKRQAEVVMTALWDASPIRRCSGRPGSRNAPCHFAQLGVAFCACSPGTDTAAYERAVTALLSGLTDDPESLLAPLADKMLAYARTERFEEAAVVRDRYRALAHALDGRRRWQALVTAGRISAESRSGDGAHIEHGRLVGAWRSPDPPPLFGVSAELPDAGEVPESIAAAEEAALIWAWLETGDVEILDSMRPLALPTAGVCRLESRAG